MRHGIGLTVALIGAVVVGTTFDRAANAFDGISSAPATASATMVTYRFCSDARAAGAAPLYRGQPGYAAHLDRDNDGVACERVF